MDPACAEPKTIATGVVWANAAQTDPVFQKWAVAKLDDGQVWYYHPQFGDWYDCPAEWMPRIKWNTLESCEWNGSFVFPTLGCHVDGRGPMCGLFASEDDARSPDADSLAVAIVTLDSLTRRQVETARRNTDRRKGVRNNG